LLLLFRCQLLLLLLQLQLLLLPLNGLAAPDAEVDAARLAW
jgi:hypothetical protein